MPPRSPEPQPKDLDEQDETVQLLSTGGADSDVAPVLATGKRSIRWKVAAFVNARLGLLMALAGTLTFSLMTVCVRLVPYFGPPVPVFFIVVVRGCIVTTSSLWSLWRRGINPLGPRPYFGWLVFRGSMGFTALSSYYYGLYHLRVADAVVLQKTCPVLVCIIATLWLKEKFSMYDISASMLCLGGVVMVVQSEDEPTAADVRPMAMALSPPMEASQEITGATSASGVSGESSFDWSRVGAVLVTLGSAVSSAFAYVTIRKLKTDKRGLVVDPMVLVLYFAFICVPGGAIGLYLGEDEVPWSRLTAAQMTIIVFGCGMLGFVGQTLLNSSFQLESAVRCCSARRKRLLASPVLIWN